MRLKDYNTNKENYINREETALFRERLEERLDELYLTRKQLAEKAGISESIIDKWLNGNKDSNGEMRYIPPSFKLLKKVAKALNVSTDYFVDPDMDCLTVTNQKIHDITGLSDTAINNLKSEYSEMKKNSLSRDHAIDMINILLSDQDAYKLLTTMYHYLFGNYTHTTSGDTTMKLLDDTEIPANGAEIPIPDINSLFLASITDKLSKLKVSLAEIPNSKYYGKLNPETATDRAKLSLDIMSYVE